jgi:Transposase DDE domain
VLKPAVARYLGTVSRIYFRADAGFANPEVYDFLEAECMKYAIRLPANPVLQDGIGYLLNRPVGRPPNASRGETPITRQPALAPFLASLLRQLFL